jgi:outer membrane protein OmpA-like peptidoglycan-associated protein
MRFLLPTGFMLMLSCFAAGQSSFLPKSVGPSVNSIYDEINPVMTPDGRTLFFVRVNHPENTFGFRDSEDIWFSTRIDDSTWTSAMRLPDLNVGRYNAVLSVSDDGNTILLNGVYNRTGKIWKKRGLSVSSRVNDSWSIPERVKVKKFSKKNRGMRSSASMSADGNLILLSYSKAYNGERNDLYYSTRKANGTFSRPKKIKNVNSRLNEETPFISADGRSLYFASDRNEKGRFNIYKAVRQGNDWKSWSAPSLLSDTINSAGWDAYFKTNLKGSWAVFASTKGPGNADIFSVKLFEENPFVVVSGNVINEKTGALLNGRNFSILVDGKKPDSLSMDIQAATYRVKLPLGRSYNLTVSVPNFVPLRGTVDVARQREFTTRDLDLYASPLPFVLLKGRVVVRDKQAVISNLFNPRILVDNAVIDSLRFDAGSGTYEVKLAHGKAYQLKAEALKHESVPASLDLSQVNEYQEINLDLYLEEDRMATVSGRILDKKTGNPLAKLSQAKINVEGMSSVIATIDTLTGYYELKLPYGTTYTISAAAPKYYPLFESIDLIVRPPNERVSKDLIIVPVEVGQSIRLNNIFFDPGKAILKSASFPELDRVIEFLLNNPEIKIEIAGHTDNVGKSATNLKLSQSRAKSVADYILKKGVSNARVVSKGYGSAKPVVANSTKEGKARNRRVEFTILDN